MPDTFQALATVIIAVLPGALHTWAFEREVGNWGAALADRVLRFIGLTAVYQLLFSFGLYRLWTEVLHRRDPVGARVVFRNLLYDGSPIPVWAWAVPVVYIGLPLTLGTIAGMSVHRWPRVARLLAGRDPAPRAWDFLFSRAPSGIIRVQLKDGHWIGGLFGRRSYASGFPAEPDLLLERSFRVSSDGSFARGDGRGGYDEIGSAIMISGSEIKSLEFFDAEETHD